MPAIPRGLPKVLMRCCSFWPADSAFLTVISPRLHENSIVDGMTYLDLVCYNTWLGVLKDFNATAIEDPKVVPYV